MIKFQKTSSFALLFSVAIHVVVLSILYINFSKTNTTAVYRDEFVKYKKNNELSDKVVNDKASTISVIETVEENKQKLSLLKRAKM